MWLTRRESFSVAGGAVDAIALDATASAASGNDVADRAQAIDAIVHQEMERRHIPGLTLAILHNGAPAYLKAYGRADLELDRPMKTTSLFQSASTGKIFTAAAILSLAREGRLTLDDPIARYFPDAPAAWSLVTPRHMMSHRSGLADLAPERLDADGHPMNRALEYSDADLQRMFESWPMEFAPGTRFSYNNVAYVMLGLLVKQVSGMDYGDYLRARFFSPLGMQTAQVNDILAVVPERVRGFLSTSEGALVRPGITSRSLSRMASGSLLFSAYDWMSWAESLDSGRGLSSGELAECWRTMDFPDGSAPVINYGLGWFLLDVRGRRLMCHHGITNGFSSWVGHYPDDRLTVAVMCNLVTGHPGQFSARIAGLFDDRLGPRTVMPETDNAGSRRRASIRSWMEGKLLSSRSAADIAHHRRALGDFGKPGETAPELLSIHDGTYLYQVRNAQTVGLVELKAQSGDGAHIRMQQAWPNALYETAT